MVCLAGLWLPEALHAPRRLSRTKGQSQRNRTVLAPQLRIPRIIEMQSIP